MAVAAERAGYDSVWVSDHVLVPRDKPRYAELYEALTTLAYVGARTERIKLGTSVLIAAQRDAVLLAKQAATVDALTGGRLILGLGTGWMEGEFKNLGADFHTRGRKLDESIRVMRALWATDERQFDGKFYRFSDASFGPRPVQPGGIPLWIGGASDAALRRVAELGDGWHADDLTVDQLREGIARLRAATAESGRQIVVSLRRSTDLRPAMGAGREFVTGGVRGGRYQAAESGVFGGSVDQVQAGLAEYAGLGVDHFIFQFENSTLDQHLAQIDFFAREILPAWKQA